MTRCGIALRRVDAGADGGAAQIDLAQQIGEFAQAVDVLADGDGKGAELRAQPHGHRIHQLRTADLDDIVEFDGLCQQAPPSGRWLSISAGQSRRMVRRTAVG